MDSRWWSPEVRNAHAKWAVGDSCGRSREVKARGITLSGTPTKPLGPSLSAGGFSSFSREDWRGLLAAFGRTVKSDRPAGLVLKRVLEKRGSRCR